MYSTNLEKGGKDTNLSQEIVSAISALVWGTPQHAPP